MHGRKGPLLCCFEDKYTKVAVPGITNGKDALLLNIFYV